MLPFESWLVSADAPAESVVAFRESIASYKTGAYRAGLLFGYVGLGLWLRSRLIAASCPTGVPAGQWRTLQQDLRDENKWDAMVFDCTQMRAPKDVFAVDEQLRDEIKYWKNRRNDCAHFKNNEIAASHVESFWLFLRSSIGRWVPNGSAQDLIERLARHFDPNLTPPDSDVRPLVDLLPHAVQPADLNAFFDDMERRFTTQIGTFTLVNKESLVAVCEAILGSMHPVTRPAVVQWLLSHPEILMGVLRRWPSHVQALRGQPSEIRNLWRASVFAGGHKDLPVVAALLRNGLIPQNEIDEAVERTVQRLNDDIPTKTDEPILAANGFWRAFVEHAMANRQIDKFDWGNRNARLIAWRVEHAPVDRETASALCETFAAEPYPFAVRDALKAMLAANPAKMADLQAAASRAGTVVPKALQ